jgi:Na+-translocating ferredoxin:NAD+ oxidoreductase RNF subunit RnfB
MSGASDTRPDFILKENPVAYFIHENCTGCTACARKCPVGCISGERNALHTIFPIDCISCGVCAIYCPVDAISDPDGVMVAHLKASAVPKAKVVEDECTGCEFCIDICPFDCITLSPSSEGGFFSIATVNEKKCVGCKLCETVCAKDAIYVERKTPFLLYLKTA